MRAGRDDEMIPLHLTTHGVHTTQHSTSIATHHVACTLSCLCGHTQALEISPQKRACAHLTTTTTIFISWCGDTSLGCAVRHTCAKLHFPLMRKSIPVMHHKRTTYLVDNRPAALCWHGHYSMARCPGYTSYSPELACCSC